jgi:iron complex outermembrane recepter protein
MKNVKKRLSIRRALLEGTIITSMMVIGGTAIAQNDVEVDDRIIVTGSRILTDSATSAPSPVLSIGGDDIATSGKTDITQLLRETPSLQGSLPANFSAFNGADTEDSALGISFLNLRSLGIERTLVLQNGRRHVSGSAGQSSVDVNTIPISMLDRVEVLTGGASSIYGADAVSGVVNFILRDGGDFDGLEVRGQGGLTGKGDAKEAFLSVATGFEFDGGRGSTVVGVEYTRTEAVFASERSFAGSGLRSFAPNNSEVATFLGINPNADNTFVPDYRLPISSRFGIIALGDTTSPPSAFFSVASSPDGTFGTVGSANIPAVQVFDNGTLRPFNGGDIFIDGFDAIGGDGIAANPDVELILPKTSRVVFNANTKYEVADRINFFVESKFAFTDTFDSTQVNGFNDDIPIALDNPFIPSALQAQIASLQGDGLTPLIVMSRDTLDNDVRALPNAERTTFRIVGGFTGDLTDSISYELSYNYGRTSATIKNVNTRIEDRFFAAVDAVRDPMTGQIVCRSDLDPSAIPPVSPFPEPRSGFSTFNPGDGSCAPINLFGENAITGAGATFAFIDTFDKTTLTQEVLLASLSGDTSDAFELPAGPIGWAAGFEYRKEKSEFIPDPLDTAGLTFGSVSAGPTQPSGGEFSVYEGFFEAKIPLLSGLPLVEFLEANGSVRLSDYNTIGTTTTWAVGGRYGPSDWLTFRGTYSKAVRAPNIGELFSPQNPATIGATQDPCNPQFINAGTQFRAANCAMFVAPGFNSTTFNSAFVPGLSGGNPNLSEEQATTITAGFVFNPKDGPLDGLTVIADFYDIKISSAIDALSAFDIAQACVDLPSINNQFCNQIFRDPTDGFITGFVSGQINLGSLETRGVDWSVVYTFDVSKLGGQTDLGTLSLSSVGTRFLRYNEFQDPTDLSVFEDRLGSFTRPEWIVNFRANWRLNDFGVGWAGRLASSQLLPGIDNSDLVSNPTFSDPFRTGRAFVHDITLDYQLSDNINIYGGVNNVLDRDPFVGTLSRPAGPRGRFFFLGVQANL